MSTATEKAKHTPGPWHLSHQLAEGFSVAHEIAPNCGRLLVVATCGTQAKTLGHEIIEETARANAKLIAAAPEMLEALRHLLKETANYFPVLRDLKNEKNLTVSGLGAAYVLAEQAIREAIGE